MNNNYRGIIALDVDDVLMPCVDLAADLVGVSDKSLIDQWDIKGTKLPQKQIDAMMDLWKTEAFVMCQKPYPGAIKFVQRLVDAGFCVMIASSVPPEVMSARGMAIRNYFPMIQQDHIVLGNMKRLLHVDVLMDDNPKNLGGFAKHCILVTRNHNRSFESPYPRVENYDAALDLILTYCPE